MREKGETKFELDKNSEVCNATQEKAQDDLRKEELITKCELKKFLRLLREYQQRTKQPISDREEKID